MKNEMHHHSHNHEHHHDHHAWEKEHYDREDTNGKLVMTLRDLSHAMRGLYEGRGSQKRILIVLSETDTITQRELTQRLGIQPGSASEVIAKLENAGLVVRTESEADRRTVDITLTEEGRRQAEEAKSQRTGRHQEMFSVLSDEEKGQLLALLEKINADWRERFAGHHGGHRHHGEGEGHPHEEGEGKRGCDHDCANCSHPCGHAKR